MSGEGGSASSRARSSATSGRGLPTISRRTLWRRSPSTWEAGRRPSRSVEWKGSPSRQDRERIDNRAGEPSHFAEDRRQHQRHQDLPAAGARAHLPPPGLPPRRRLPRARPAPGRHLPRPRPSGRRAPVAPGLGRAGDRRRRPPAHAAGHRPPARRHRPVPRAAPGPHPPAGRAADPGRPQRPCPAAPRPGGDGRGRRRRPGRARRAGVPRPGGGLARARGGGAGPRSVHPCGGAGRPPAGLRLPGHDPRSRGRVLPRGPDRRCPRRQGKSPGDRNRAGRRPLRRDPGAGARGGGRGGRHHAPEALQGPPEDRRRPGQAPGDRPRRDAPARRGGDLRHRSQARPGARDPDV